MKSVNYGKRKLEKVKNKNKTYILMTWTNYNNIIHK